MNRDCPRAHPVTPHEIRQDDKGRWFCPYERDAELEREYNARQAEIAALEEAFALVPAQEDNK